MRRKAYLFASDDPYELNEVITFYLANTGSRDFSYSNTFVIWKGFHHLPGELNLVLECNAGIDSVVCNFEEFKKRCIIQQLGMSK
jgi:hypothetical protein